MTHCIINEIDGDTFQTILSGPKAEVRAECDDWLNRLIDQAEQDGKAQDAREIDGEEHVVKVIVR